MKSEEIENILREYGHTLRIWSSTNYDSILRVWSSENPDSAETVASCDLSGLISMTWRAKKGIVSSIIISKSSLAHGKKTKVFLANKLDGEKDIEKGFSEIKKMIASVHNKKQYRYQFELIESVFMLTISKRKTKELRDIFEIKVFCAPFGTIIGESILFELDFVHGCDLDSIHARIIEIDNDNEKRGDILFPDKNIIPPNVLVDAVIEAEIESKGESQAERLLKKARSIEKSFGHF